LAHGGTPSTRMRDLGGALHDVASLDDDAFQARMRDACAPVDEARADRLRALLGQIGTNAPWWTRDAVRLLAQLEGRLSKGAYAVPCEMLSVRDAGEARREFRRIVARIGALLDAWPAMVEAAAH